MVSFFNSKFKNFKTIQWIAYLIDDNWFYEYNLIKVQIKIYNNFKIRKEIPKETEIIISNFFTTDQVLKIFNLNKEVFEIRSLLKFTSYIFLEKKAQNKWTVFT